MRSSFVLTEKDIKDAIAEYIKNIKGVDVDPNEITLEVSTTESGFGNKDKVITAKATEKTDTHGQQR